MESLQNRAELWGGGFLALFGFYNATGTTHNNNFAKIGALCCMLCLILNCDRGSLADGVPGCAGGGGMALVSSVGLITGGTVNGNSALYGGGIGVEKQTGSSPVPSILVLTVSYACCSVHPNHYNISLTTVTNKLPAFAVPERRSGWQHGDGQGCWHQH